MRRMPLSAGAVVLSIAAVVAAGQRTRPEDRGGQGAAAEAQWEYLVVGGGNHNLSTAGNEQYGSMRKQPDGSFTRELFPLERNLDKLGAKGWELVAVYGPPTDPFFYLKRPKNSGR